MGKLIADQGASGAQCGDIGTFAAINRCRYGNNENVAVLQALRVCRVSDVFCGAQVGRCQLSRGILASLEFSDAALVDIEAQHGILFRKRHGERQPDIAEADNSSLTV